MTANLVLGLFMGVTILYLVLVSIVSNRLKAQHEAAWERIGRYSLFLNNSISGGVKFLRYFIFSDSYRELNDGPINGMVLAMRVLFVLWAGFFLWNGIQVFNQ